MLALLITGLILIVIKDIVDLFFEKRKKILMLCIYLTAFLINIFIVLLQDDESNQNKNTLEGIDITVHNFDTSTQSQHKLILSKADTIDTKLKEAIGVRERLVEEYKLNNARLTEQNEADKKLFESSLNETKILQEKIHESSYPLFPLIVEIQAQIKISELDPVQQTKFLNACNQFYSYKSIAFRDTGLEIIDFAPPGKRNLVMQFTLPQNPSIYEKNSTFLSLIRDFDFIIALGFFHPPLKDETDEDKSYGTFVIQLFNATNIIDAYIGYNKRALGLNGKDSTFTLRLTFQVKQEDVWKNNLLGVINLRNKILRVNFFFEQFRSIKPVVQYVSFRYPKGKPSFFDFSDAKVYYNKRNNAFGGKSYAHLIKDSELNFTNVYH